MGEKKGFIDSEELMMMKIEKMKFQVVQVEYQKNKIIGSFRHLGLEDAALALESRIAICDVEFQQNVRDLEKDGYNKIIDAYQQYINAIWDELFEAVLSFKIFGENIVDDGIVRKRKK